MGEVFQFKRKPAARNANGFCIKVDLDKEAAKAHADAWGIQDRGGYRISPDRDGTVVLEVKHPGGVVRLDMSVEDAEQLRTDLARAAQGAERVRAKARGAREWITEPLDGGGFAVSYDDKKATFVETKVRRPHRCRRCRNTMPEGTIMYRQEGAGSHRWRGGSVVYKIGSILNETSGRICRACMSPKPQAEALAPVG